MLGQNNGVISRKKNSILLSIMGTSVLFAICCFMTYVPDQIVEPLNAGILVAVILGVLAANAYLNLLSNKVLAYGLRWCLYTLMFFAIEILAGMSYRWEIVLLLATYLMGSDWYRNDYKTVHGERRSSGTIRIKR